jgi:ABC-type transport system substrate-binding protein/methyl-accepting chemotaxis protein
MENTALSHSLSEQFIADLLKILKEHTHSISASNTELHSMLTRREVALRNLTTSGYSLSEHLTAMRKETHNLFASIQIIAEATEVALSALEEQKKDWENRYARLDGAITGFSRITETISKSIKSLRELGERIKLIEEAMNRVHKISHLTQGVSRNAGIKAYHAGEKGKGFEVIARELSQLTKESLSITSTVPEAIAKFQTQTREAVNFITDLTHNIVEVEQLSGEMKQKLQSSERLLSEFMEASSIIHNAVDKQIRIKDKLGNEEETISSFTTESLIATGNITTMEQSQTSLSLLINEFVGNASRIISLIEQKGEEEIDSNLQKSIINADKLKEYISRVSLLTSQIKETSLDSMRHFKSQEEKMSQIIAIINENRSIKQEISEKTNTLMHILEEVVSLFEATNTLSSKIIEIITSMTRLVGRADEYFIALEDEIAGVETILKKLKQFSKRSNLLSLYAAIESARAFQFKKELDVIVTQIKDLSKQSSGSLRSIENSVNMAKSSLRNVHHIMFDATGKLQHTEGEFKPLLSGFKELNESAAKLNDLVREMLRTLERQTILERRLLTIEENISGKIGESITSNQELVYETEKTESIVLSLLRDISELEKILIPAVSKFGKPAKKVMRLRLSGDIIDIDPSTTTDATSHRVTEIIFKGLVEQGMDANIIPAIAKRWRVSGDGLVWEFSLRDDVQFHNGDLLTAMDVKRSIQHLLLGPNRYMCDMIRGAQDYIKKKKGNLEGVTPIGTNTVRIELSHPYIPFLRNLGVTCAAISKETDTGMVGTGPYVLKQWIKDERIIVERFDACFGKRPFYDEVHFIVCKDEQEAAERFLNHEFDILDIPSSIDRDKLQSQEGEAISIESMSVYDIYYVGINVQRQSPLQDRLVRQAMNYAIDRDEYIERIAKQRAIPAKGIFPPNFPTFNPELSGYHFNPDKAKSLLREAGFPAGLPGEHRFDIRDSRIAVQSAEIIQRHLAEVGIRVTLNPMPWQDLLRSAHAGQSLLFSLGWSNDNGDPDSFLYPLFHSKNFGSPGNTSYYDNKAVDALLDEAATLIDNYQREALYRQVEQIIVDDAPWIFLYHSKHFFALQHHIQGYVKNPLATERLEDVWSL